MDNNAAQTNSTPEYPRDIYEPVLATSMELDEFMRQDFTISYFDLDGDHEVRTCYGDVKMTIDALRLCRHPGKMPEEADAEEQG